MKMSLDASESYLSADESLNTIVVIRNTANEAIADYDQASSIVEYSNIIDIICTYKLYYYSLRVRSPF